MKLTISNLRIIALPLGLFLLVLVLFVFGGRFIWLRVASLQVDLAAARKTEQILQDKVNLLQAAQVTLAAKSSNLVIALPAENSSLLILSQIRNLAGQFSLVITDLKVGSQSVGEGLSKAEIKFEIEGSRDAVFAFLKGISQISPVMSIQNVRLNESLGVVRVTVSLLAYWSAFPEKLPPVTQTLEPLSIQEEEIISEISQRTQPLFNSELTPSAAVERPNPFLSGQ